MPTIKRKQSTTPKQVICTHCAQPSEVGHKAMSVFCPHCRKRLILEDLKVTSYHAVREFTTCGDIVVEKRGHIAAAVKASFVTIKGKIHGNVCARSGVRLHKTASLQGDIETPVLVIESGATINGFVRIGCVPARETE